MAGWVAPGCTLQRCANWPSKQTRDSTSAWGWLYTGADSYGRVTVDDITNTAALDDYWQTHRLDRAGGVEQSISPQDIVEQGDESQAWKKKPISDAAGLGQDPHALSVDHPALSLAGHLEAFGPLLFPLYRAALLRKRILVLTHPPVQKACDLGKRDMSLSINHALILT